MRLNKIILSIISPGTTSLFCSYFVSPGLSTACGCTRLLAMAAKHMPAAHFTNVAQHELSNKLAQMSTQEMTGVEKKYETL